MSQDNFEETADLKLARLPPRSPLPFAALPSVSLLPAAPLKLACFPRSLAAARRGFTFYVADPLSSIHG
jgi:hypothetical protein